MVTLDHVRPSLSASTPAHHPLQHGSQNISTAYALSQFEKNTGEPCMPAIALEINPVTYLH